VHPCETETLMVGRHVVPGNAGSLTARLRQSPLSRRLTQLSPGSATRSPHRDGVRTPARKLAIVVFRKALSSGFAAAPAG